MKMRRLPETDLARIAPLPADQKRRALEQVKIGFPPFSYAPIRRTSPDILNAQPEMFGPTDPTPWLVVEKLIRDRSRTSEEFENNIAVAAALHTTAVAQNWQTKSHEFYPMPLSIGIKVEYWLRAVIMIDGQPVVPFFDPRRTRRLTEAGRQFAFSMMHERIRVAEPDLARVVLGVFQFEQSKGGGRTLRLYTDAGVRLFSFDELERMVAETYSIWNEVLDDRQTEIRRRAGGKGGSLL